MNIIKYINSKNKCHIFNLSKNKNILNDLKLEKYSSSDNYKKSSTNTFTKQDLVIFIVSSCEVKDKTVFKMANNINNVLISVVNDSFIQNNETEFKNVFFSYGYKYRGKTIDDKVLVFIYDIAEYKDNPDWLNNKNWANPELWEK